MAVAIKDMNENNQSHFKNITDNLFTAKKDKISNVREAERRQAREK